MSMIAVIIAVAVLVVFVVLVELVAAVLPLVIIITCVPAPDRQALADLIAATDSSRRLRLSRALRVAVRARRGERRGGEPFAGAEMPLSPRTPIVR